MSRTSILEKALTPKQLEFVKHRSRGDSTTVAARKAGYRQLQLATRQVEMNPRVQAALKMEVEEYRKVAAVTREEVICGIKDAINTAKLVADPTAQIRGWTELAKMLGYYAPETKRIELSINAEKKRHQLELLTDDELLEIAAGRRLAIEGEATHVDDDSAEEEVGAASAEQGGAASEVPGAPEALRPDEEEAGREALGGGEAPERPEER